LKGIKGHVLKFNLTPEVKDYLLFMKVGDRFILQVPQKQTKKLVLGISYEDNKTDSFVEKDEVAKILSTSQRFFESV
jgi:hypothetical protein